MMESDNRMLKPIIGALQSFESRGIAVIVETEGVDPREIAEYVLLVLNGLKCSVEHYYHDVEHSYFIQDTANEFINGEIISKCDCCGKMSTLGGMTLIANHENEFDGLACNDCLPKVTMSSLDKEYIKSLISATEDYIMISADVLEDDVKDHLQCSIDHVKAVIE